MFADSTAYQNMMNSMADLGDYGHQYGDGEKSVNAGILRIVNNGTPTQLKALVKLAGEDEGGFHSPPLRLEAAKSLVEVLEEGRANGGEVTEEEELDAVLEEGRAHMRMKEWGECKACYKRTDASTSWRVQES